MACDPLMPASISLSNSQTGEKMALNIFEPRYRLMVRRCMEGSRRFGMATVNNAHQLHAIATECEIQECQPLPDGCTSSSVIPIFYKHVSVKCVQWRRRAQFCSGTTKKEEGRNRAGGTIWRLWGGSGSGCRATGSRTATALRSPPTSRTNRPQPTPNSWSASYRLSAPGLITCLSPFAVVPRSI